MQHGRVTKKHRLEFPGFCEIKIVSLISLRKLALYNFSFCIEEVRKIKNRMRMEKLMGFSN